MASSFQQTVSDFDLNFLDQTNESVVPLSKYEKQRKKVLFLKKKTVAVGYLIEKFYEKKELLEIREKQLLAAKEECRQLSIQYKDAEDRNSNLQQDNTLLQAENKEVLGKTIDLENQFEAMKSYCNQLQLLAKENETRIQSMLLEINLEKSDTKLSQKKLQKDNDDLIKNIIALGEVVLGTRKANKKDKAILEKYCKSDVKKLEILTEDEDSNHDVFDDVSSSAAYDTACSDLDESNQSPAGQVVNTDTVGTVCEDAGRDLDSGTETKSNDTGRGSSLASSGSEKCLPSPDYFNDDTPFSPGNDQCKQKPTYVNVGTSPIKTGANARMSESPIDLDKTLTNQSSPKRTAPNVNVATSPIKKCLVTNRSTSPIAFDDDNKTRQHNTTIEMQSPSKIHPEIAVIPVEDTDKRAIDVLPSIPDEINDDEPNANEDSEIEMILTNMRMSHALVTPIPMTPSRTRSVDNRSGTGAALNEQPRGLCLEAAKIREENNVLHTQISDLAKEVMSIKSLLINRLHNSGTSDNSEEPVRSRGNSPVSCSQLPERDVQTNDDTLMDSDDVNATHSSGENNCSNSAIELDSNQLNYNVNLPVSQIATPLLEENNSSENVDTNLNVNENSNESVEVGIKYKRKSTAFLFVSDAEDSDSASEENLELYEATNNNASVDRKGALKHRKLTRLQKIRKNLIPKAKIKSKLPSPKRVVGKSKIVITPRSNDATPQTPSSKLNNEAAYEKAVKIMAELRNKEKDKALVTRERKIRPKKVCSSDSKVDAPTNSPVNIISTETPKDNEPVERITRRSSITTRHCNAKVEAPKNSPVNITSTETPKDNEPVGRITRRSSITTRNCNAKVEAPKNSPVNITSTETPKVNEPVERITRRSSVTTVNEPVERITRRSSITTRNCNAKVEASKNSPVNITSTETRRSSITTQNCNANIIVRIKHGDRLKADEAIVYGANIVKDEVQSPKAVTATLLDNPSIKYKVDSTVTATPSSPKDSIVTEDRSSPKRYITTRSRNEQNKGEIDKISTGKEVREERDDSISKDSPLLDSRKRRKRSSVSSVDMLEQNKRVLRSSSGTPANVIEPPPLANLEINMCSWNSEVDIDKNAETLKSDIPKSPKNTAHTLTSYDDLDMFGNTDDMLDNTDTTPKKKPRLSHSTSIKNPHDSVLCAMLDKYGVAKMKGNPQKSPPDTEITSEKEKIEAAIAIIIELPPEKTKPAMDKLVTEIKGWHWKDFMLGLLKYLTDPARKDELLSKRHVMNSPAMTKSEQVLLYVLAQLKHFWPNINFINYLLDNIEYTLFRLNKTPDFEIIDSLSHLYAVLCRYIKAKNRLRLFMMDAMYCMQFKAVPLIRQCLDVWMHVLPLAHMGIAKTPLVTCLVYLLHFYKCEDRFNRVQDIRHILNRSYSYQITEWNEPKILELFRNAIRDHKDIQVEKKMLRMALIIMAKRHGPRWCQKNMIKGILQTIIDEEDAPERAKLFCVSMLGPLMKPYPVDMKVNVEVVINQLLDKLNRNASPQMQEAIFTSLIYINKHSQARVLQALLKWQPEKLSPDMESLLRDFVRSKPIKGWQVILSKISLDCC